MTAKIKRSQRGSFNQHGESMSQAGHSIPDNKANGLTILDKRFTTTLREQWKVWAGIVTFTAVVVTFGAILNKNGADIASLKCYNKVIVYSMVLKREIAIEDVQKCDPDIR